MKLSKFYPDDFNYGEYISFEQHLNIYIDNIRRGEKKFHLKDFGELARILMKTWRHMSDLLVYRLLKLILILSVATETLRDIFEH